MLPVLLTVFVDFDGSSFGELFSTSFCKLPAGLECAEKGNGRLSKKNDLQTIAIDCSFALLHIVPLLGVLSRCQTNATPSTTTIATDRKTGSSRVSVSFSSVFQARSYLKRFFVSVGQIVYAVTKKKQSWYPEEHEDWEVPEKYLKTKGQPEDSWKKNKNEKSQNQNNRESLSRESSDNTVVGDDESPARRSSGGDPEKKAKKQQQNQESQQSEENSDDVERQDNSESEENKEEDPNLVTWYGPNDTANPQNWSLFKKCCVTAEMCILTFSVYIGSAYVFKISIQSNGRIPMANISDLLIASTLLVTKA